MGTCKVSSISKTDISNNLHGNEDAFRWRDGQEQENDDEASEEYIPPSWDMVDLYLEKWNALVANSEDRVDYYQIRLIIN